MALLEIILLCSVLIGIIVIFINIIIFNNRCQIKTIKEIIKELKTESKENDINYSIPTFIRNKESLEVKTEKRYNPESNSYDMVTPMVISSMIYSNSDTAVNRTTYSSGGGSFDGGGSSDSYSSSSSDSISSCSSSDSGSSSCGM